MAEQVAEVEAKEDVHWGRFRCGFRTVRSEWTYTKADVTCPACLQSRLNKWRVDI